MRTIIQYSILVLLLLVSCKDSNDNAVGQDEASTDSNAIFVNHEQFERSEMEIGSLTQHPFAKTIKVTGIVDVPPQYKAKVTAKMGGFIKETSLLEGDEVKKGQFLVSIENPEFVSLQQSYLETKERLAYLKSEFERQKTLFEEQIISEKKYLKAESDYKSAQAKTNGLRKQLQLLNIPIAKVDQGVFSSVARIYAPISGNVSSINVSKGSPVSPESVILEIIDNSHLHIEMTVYEKDILNVKKGQSVWFKIPEAMSDMHEAEIYLVGTTIEPNRTIKVHSHPKDESLTLLPGMFVSAEIIIDSVEAMALPDLAFTEVEGEHLILKLKNKTDAGYEFEAVDVSIISSDNNYTSFRESETFTTEDQFLVKGAYALIGE